MNVTEYRHDALRVDVDGDWFLVTPCGPTCWTVRHYRRYGAGSAGKLLGRYPNREAAIAAIEEVTQ